MAVHSPKPVLLSSTAHPELRGDGDSVPNGVLRDIGLVEDGSNVVPLPTPEPKTNGGAENDKAASIVPLLPQSPTPEQCKISGSGGKTHQPHQTHHAVAFTVIQNTAGLATKTFALDANGALQKETAAQIYDGRARIEEARGLRGVLDRIERLGPNEAVAFGLASMPDARICTQEELKRGATGDAIARDREHFAFAAGQPGVLMLDHDPRPGQQPLGRRSIDAILCDVVPGWLDVERAWRPSASAFIYRTKDDAEMIGTGGWRCYVLVDDAAKIPDVGDFIYQTLWARGHGYIRVSKSGQVLDRSLVDASVWQPERLDFAASPKLGPGIERRAPRAVIVGSKPLFASASLRPECTMAEWRSSSATLAEARRKARGEVAGARKAYIAEQMAEIGKRMPKARTRYMRGIISRAVEQQCLSGEFLLCRPDGSMVPVAELLADIDKWDGARFADPLEPDYRNDRRIAYACLRPESGAPYIFSHAHGGIRFSLVRESAEIHLTRGEQPRVVDEGLAVVRGRGEVFERGGELVRLTDDGIAPTGDEWILDYLSRHVHFTAMRRRGNVAAQERVDPPPWLARRISAKHGERGLRELRGVITAPTMRPDGSLLVTAGYDDETGLLLKDGRWPSIPDRPNTEELKQAAATLWRPFAEFLFVDETARSVWLSTLLTGFIRPSLPLAPGTSVDAPEAGTGKTLLGQCALVLLGMAPTAIPECRDEEEIRKRLLAALRTGRPAILFDNIRGLFGSASIEAMLTTEFYSDRMLGVSQMVSLPTAALVLFSGNNFRPSGDLWRRILTARIDAKTDAPERRYFTLDALVHCRQHRQAIVTAGLTLLRGFVVAGMPRKTDDKLASFEQWDSLVRQAVIWIGEQKLMAEGASVGDPVKAIEKAKEAEPERQRLAAFLTAVTKLKGDAQWSTHDLVKAAVEAAASPIHSEVAQNPASELHDALVEISDDRGRVNPRKIGRWIEKKVDQRVDGAWLAKVGIRTGRPHWAIVRDKPAPGAAEREPGEDDDPLPPEPATESR